MVIICLFLCTFIYKFFIHMYLDMFYIYTYTYVLGVGTAGVVGCEPQQVSKSII